MFDGCECVWSLYSVMTLLMRPCSYPGFGLVLVRVVVVTKMRVVMGIVRVEVRRRKLIVSGLGMGGGGYSELDWVATRGPENKNCLIALCLQ